MARELNGQMALLQVIGAVRLQICLLQLTLPHGCPCMQRMSQELEGVWRMAAMRENAAKRATWKG